ncbi:Uncharacterised protein [Segatella copri]|nr:Uncharacterised protein [Segatella copri]
MLELNLLQHCYRLLLLLHKGIRLHLYPKLQLNHLQLLKDVFFF